MINNIDVKTIVPFENKFKKYIFFGFEVNVGHHLWNEISGLYYFLKNKKFHDKIDGIVIGPRDIFNIEDVLRKNYNFEIKKFDELHNNYILNTNINLKNIFPIFLYNFYIEKDLGVFFNNFNFEKKLDDNILELSINLRTHNRYLMNQDIFYTNLIKKINEDYQNYIIKINFLGYFKTHINQDNNNIEKTKQNAIVESIIEKFNENKNIIFNNFIDTDFFDIVKKTINSKIFIGSHGTTTSNLMNWIYRSKFIVFGPIEAYNWAEIQFNVLQNYDCLYVPKEYIKLSTGLNNPFDVDFDLYYEFLKKEINQLIIN